MAFSKLEADINIRENYSFLRCNYLIVRYVYNEVGLEGFALTEKPTKA